MVEQYFIKGTPVKRVFQVIHTLAHRIINEGADIIVGHFPHLLRGMEMCNSKPIFNSLGNSIDHNETVNKLPADSHKRFQIDSTEVFRIRNKDGEKGFPDDGFIGKLHAALRL